MPRHLEFFLSNTMFSEQQVILCECHLDFNACITHLCIATAI